METCGAVENLDADDRSAGGADAHIDAGFDFDVFGGLGLANPRVQQIHIRLVVTLEVDGLL